MSVYIVLCSSDTSVSDSDVNAVFECIGEHTKRGVFELASETGLSPHRVQRALEVLMERGGITTTPEWKYRHSR